MSADQFTVFVVEDDAATRELVVELMRSVKRDVDAYASAEEFLAKFDGSRAGCLVLDVRLPGMSGLELQTALAGYDIAPPPIVFITAFADVSMTTRAIKGGCVDFIEKPFNSQALLDAVQKAIEIGRHERTNWTLVQCARNHYKRLTQREREVMHLIVEGKTNKEISKCCGISPRTVEIHRANVMRKMHAASLPELVQITLTHKLRTENSNPARP